MNRMDRFVGLFTILSPALAFQCVPTQLPNIPPPKCSIHTKHHTGILYAATTSSRAMSDSVRAKRTVRLGEWAQANEIKLGGVQIENSESGAGLGLRSTQNLPSGALVVTVPSNVALSVESPGGGPDDPDVIRDLIEDRRAFRELPWFVQFSAYLYHLDNVLSVRRDSLDMKPWLESLPRSFDTPIHWDKSIRDELQYPHLTAAIARQENEWNKLHHDLLSAGGSPLSGMSFSDFLWGCECARSRAFSGGYTGSAFNPAVYAFTLLLVTAYVGLNIGSLEQAANGAALVVCASIFKDFVVPKLFKTRRYVICPIIDMANHKSMKRTAEVSFEFFGDSYSLAMDSDATISKGEEVYISYGTRSNDQLLQFYGFVEKANPHDVYVMPPLREWNIAALEEACGRTFEPGRLQKLDRAGLLGSTFEGGKDDMEVRDGAANPLGGVVITRSGGLDPAVLQALRALVSSESEWRAAGEAIGNFSSESAGGSENERLARVAAQAAVRLELKSKPTTIQEDEQLLQRMRSSSAVQFSQADILAVAFRIEKKTLLSETIENLSS